MGEPTEDCGWSTSYSARELSAADLGELDVGRATFADADRTYSARLQRAGLARQVRIVGWSATDNAVTGVKVLCRVPEVDRAAITAVFAGIHVEWFARLADGTIRPFQGRDS